ncbi:MAG: hypothetical protein GKC10_07030 [Methanosarcinales archaeon]|nr:hypothetical protein [Methanosarcinales archaeon]
MKEIESLQEWTGVIGGAGEIGMCGLGLQTTGQDPLASKIRLACVALPDRGVCAADLFRLGSDALDELAVLMEDDRVMKVMHEAKVGLAFLQAKLGRRLKFKNVFDIMLASQVCWSGFYDLVPSSSKKNPWKKRPVDHSLEALAERHLGVRLDRSQEALEWSEKPVSRKLIRSAARRAQTLLPLQACFQELIRRNHLERVADIELRAIAPVVEMELSGIYLDEGAARKLAAEKEAALVRAVMDLQASARDWLSSIALS